MANDIASHFYASLNLPLQERCAELTRLIDQASPFKDLQALFPQLVGSVFGVNSAAATGWGLRTITQENNPYEFDELHRFLSPQGPVFRLCYKLLADPQLKYFFSLNMLPLDIQQMLERGRYPQFYADLLNIDAQTIHLVSLALNPFDYYMFHFATHLLNSNLNKFTWESYSAYVSLACDYLTHFLPTDTVAVTPLIPYYTGKAPTVAPLQTSNRQLHSPSLLLIQDLPGLDGQHSPSSTQSQLRNEIWRTETVMQVFIDIWLSVDDRSPSPIDTHAYVPAKCPLPSTTGERVKVARMLVKQIHAFSCKYASDPIPSSSTLRKYARQTMCLRVYKFVMYLVTTWPLDTSFRLVLELWLSSIQPWRYTDSELLNRYPDRYGAQVKRKEDKSSKPVDLSYTQFIAENLPAYTTVFQQMVPRFMRLDLTVPKNAIMVFRLAKVFAQPNLASIIREVEIAAVGQNIGMNQSTDVNWNMSYSYYSMPDIPMSNKWGAIAKQAIAELNPSTNTCYQPMWGEQSRELAFELMKKMAHSKVTTEKTISEIERKIQHQNKGFWSFLNFWMTNDEEDFILADRKSVPVYLGIAIQHICDIFGFESSLLLAEEPAPESPESSSFMSSSQLPHIPPWVRNNSTNVKYMGDPELIPIGSYECTILVRILYQISTRLNEMYQQEMLAAWRREDLWGSVCREILQPPRTIHTYTIGGRIVAENLPPRISLRRFASQAFLIWLSIGYAIFYALGYGGLTYLIVLTFVYFMFVFCKATMKQFGLIEQDHNINATT